jgi:5-methylcytosine-specific restriction endonuclease McrA
MPTKLASRRLTAFERQSGRCFYCGLPMWLEHPHELADRITCKPPALGALRCTAEHLLARQDGGRDGAGNIAAACLSCNRRRHQRKHALEPSLFRNFVRKRVRKGKWHPPALLSAFKEHALTG